MTIGGWGNLFILLLAAVHLLSAASWFGGWQGWRAGREDYGVASPGRGPTIWPGGRGIRLQADHPIRPHSFYSGYECLDQRVIFKVLNWVYLGSLSWVQTMAACVPASDKEV